MSVGWCLSIGKIREKLQTNQQPSLKQYVKCAIQNENQQNHHRPNGSFTFHAKKVKEALRTRLSGNKITWTETFVRSEKFAKWKTTLNQGTLACHENLPIKTHFKNNVQSFLYSGVCTAFPQVTQKILITDTCHPLEPVTVILGFWKYTLLEKQSVISEFHFRKSKVSIFKSNFGWVGFNAHHFFMQKQFMCVDCYTRRLTFFNVSLHKRAIRWILVASQAEMRKDECVPEIVAYEWNLVVINYWREIL